MARLRDLLGYKTYAIRSDGAKFVNGVRDDGADTSWLTYQNGVLTLGPGFYDELLILDRAATEDEIRSWYVSQAPFYDAETQIQGTHIADGAITTDKLAANSVSADKIYGGTLRLTGSMKITNEAGTVEIDASGFRMTAADGSQINIDAGSVEIVSNDGRTKFLGDRWEVYDNNNELRVRIGRL